MYIISQTKVRMIFCFFDILLASKKPNIKDLYLGIKRGFIWLRKIMKEEEVLELQIGT